MPEKRLIIYGRASFVFVWRPMKKEDPNDDDKYGLTLLVPKDAEGTKSIKQLSAMAKVALNTKLPGKKPKEVNWPIKDGDKNCDEYPEQEGCYVLHMKSFHRPPGVVDRNKNRIDGHSPETLQSGDWVNVSATCYGYTKGKKGVGINVQNIQLVKKGEPLDGNIPPEKEDFPNYEDDGDTDYDSGSEEEEDGHSIFG